VNKKDMRITIERLRTWIVLLAVVLLAAIVGFFGYARYRVRHIGRDLPGKLGLEIQQSTNGFTLSKSERGHTLFTLHASKAVQYKGAGRAVLHDVSITLYGNDNSRADHVYGSAFEYDPESGEARATGPVQIDAAAPLGATMHGAGVTAAGASGKPGAGSNIHVTTSGLVFNQKTGKAETLEPIAFTYEDSRGSAKGASYDSSSGVLVLQSEVSLRSQKNGNDLTIHAEHAEFNRGSRELALLKESTEYEQTRTSSDQALVLFRENGSAARVDARGHVLVKDDEGRNVKSTNAEVLFDGEGNPQQMRLDGGLFFAALEADHDIHGDANTGLLEMSPHGELKHVTMRNAASVVDQENNPPGNPHGSVTRQVQASQIDIDFQRVEGHAEAKSILAAGGATVTEHTIYAATMPQNTTIKGDELFATMRNGRELDTLRGTGHTILTNTNPQGVSQTSSGDTLQIKFSGETGHETGQKKADAKAVAKKTGGAGVPGPVESAVQQGNLQMVQTQPGTNVQKVPSRTTATADRATFDGQAQTMRLEGGTPRLTDQGSDVTANAIEFNRVSGDVTASGDVKSSYNQAGGKNPAHAVAAKAVFNHAQDEVTLTGGDEGARLWQAADSVTAPVLVISRKQQTLAAHGASGVAAVHAVFSGQGKQPGATVLRVSSVSLLYSAAERKATFKGKVLAQQPGATVRGDAVEVYLAPNSGGGTAAAGATANAGVPNGAMPNFAGALERIVAAGNVQFEGDGRKGAGAKLVYTAPDSKFVLTGTAGQPPRISDPERGTVSGGTLTFTSRDDGIVVDGGQSPAVTETHVAR
jgi:lipopolysaccharide export system protein LptA